MFKVIKGVLEGAMERSKIRIGSRGKRKGEGERRG